MSQIGTAPNGNREWLEILTRRRARQALFADNSKFLARRLWGIANQHSFGHHGLYTMMPEAVLPHAAEVAASTAAFRGRRNNDQDSLIEFLKSLQILSPTAKSLCIR